MDSADVLAWRRIRRAIDEPGSGTTPAAFASRTYGDEAMEEAWSEFSGGGEPLTTESPHFGPFMSWFLHCWSPDPATGDSPLSGRIPTEVYLEQMGRRVDPALRRYFEACLKAAFSFFEVLRIDPGHGFEARDLFTGREHRVMERSATDRMQAGDLLFGMIVEVDGISMLECAGSYFIPPIRKIELIDFRKIVLGDKERLTPEELRGWDFELIDRYLKITDEIFNPALPEVRNTDGDLLEMHRLSFDIESPEAAIRALAHLDPGQTADQLIAGAERTTRGGIKRVTWTWQKSGNAIHPDWESTTLGRLEVKGGKLFAEVNSARRADELRALVESCLGEQARFRRDMVQSLKGMLRDAQRDPAGTAGPRQADELAQHPELQAATQEMMAKHFESWVSQSIPALDGLTPLEAMQDPDGREKVLALVIDAERHARQMTPPVDEPVLQRLRMRLGLPVEQ